MDPQKRTYGPAMSAKASAPTPNYGESFPSSSKSRGNFDAVLWLHVCEEAVDIMTQLRRLHRRRRSLHAHEDMHLSHAGLRPGKAR